MELILPTKTIPQQLQQFIVIPSTLTLRFLVGYRNILLSDLSWVLTTSEQHCGVSFAYSLITPLSQEKLKKLKSYKGKNQEQIQVVGDKYVLCFRGSQIKRIGEKLKVEQYEKVMKQIECGVESNILLNAFNSFMEYQKVTGRKLECNKRMVEDQKGSKEMEVYGGQNALAVPSSNLSTGEWGYTSTIRLKIQQE